MYLHKLVCLDIININVQGGRGRRKQFNGRQWKYDIKHSNFMVNRKKYGEVCGLIHEKIVEYLYKEYGLNPIGNFIIDSMGGFIYRLDTMNKYKASNRSLVEQLYFCLERGFLMYGRLS